eukprot:SAG11_NODE_106_length_16423_cov_51.220840_21_plen_75_part_00
MGFLFQQEEQGAEYVQTLAQDMLRYSPPHLIVAGGHTLVRTARRYDSAPPHAALIVTSVGCNHSTNGDRSSRVR